MVIAITNDGTYFIVFNSSNPFLLHPYNNFPVFNRTKKITWTF